MQCLDCGKEHSKEGISIVDYSGDDINDIEIMEKLSNLHFISESMIDRNNNIRYLGTDRDTVINLRTGRLDTAKVTVHACTVDEDIYQKLTEKFRN